MSTPPPESQGQPSSEDSGAAEGQDALALQLGELARALQAEEDTDQTLARVVQGAIELVPGAEEGSISVVRARRHVDSQAASSELPEAVDALQAETGEGPCLDAVYEQRTVRVPDMAADQRWPRFTARAAEAGAAAMLSFQLYVDGDNLGALNLYSRTAGAFDDESEHVGLLFATHAAVAFAGVRTTDELRASMATRDLIGMAKGILMERHKVTGDRAFALLARVSQDTNRKLRDVADDLVHSGRLPERPPPRP
jgi:transcriptional regulator with GAF, ATPase, and Fis domain